MSDDIDNNDKSEVGYKKPPKHTRFKKGRSGNPKGRAKGQLNLKTDLARELSEVIRLNEGGVPRQLTKQRAFLKALTARAIQGDSRASGLMLNLMMRVLDPAPEQPQKSTDISKEDEALIAAFLARHQSPKGESQ